MLVQVSAALVLIQLPKNVPGKAEDIPSTWTSTTYMGNLDGVPGFWPWPGPTLASCYGHLGSEQGNLSRAFQINIFKRFYLKISHFKQIVFSNATGATNMYNFTQISRSNFRVPILHTTWAVSTPCAGPLLLATDSLGKGDFIKNKNQTLLYLIIFLF